jgi:hypothetical protein
MKLATNRLATLVIFCTAWLLASTGFSQDKKIGFGLHASPQLSWMKPDNEKMMKNDGVKLGFGYGLMFDFRFGQNYSFSTGINVLSTNGRLEYLDTLEIPFIHGPDGVKDTLPATTITYKLGYLEIPLTLLLKTNEIGYMTYFGQFGISNQIKLKAKGDASVNEISNEDLSEEVKFINVGLLIGGGFQYSLGGNTALLVALMYNNGFTDVLKDEEKVTLKSLTLKLGIMF